MDRLDLADQVLRGRRAIGLVLRILFVPEGFAPGVEDNGEIVRFNIGAEFSQHIDDAVDRPGRLIFRIC